MLRGSMESDQVSRLIRMGYQLIADQYVLAQLPATPEAAKDFFKMLVHVKAEGLVIAEGGEEPSKY